MASAGRTCGLLVCPLGAGERGLGALDVLGVQLGPETARRMAGSSYVYKDGRRYDDPFTPDARIGEVG